MKDIDNKFVDYIRNRQNLSWKPLLETQPVLSVECLTIGKSENEEDGEDAAINEDEGPIPMIDTTSGSEEDEFLLASAMQKRSNTTTTPLGKWWQERKFVQQASMIFTGNGRHTPTPIVFFRRII